MDDRKAIFEFKLIRFILIICIFSFIVTIPAFTLSKDERDYVSVLLLLRSALNEIHEQDENFDFNYIYSETEDFLENIYAESYDNLMKYLILHNPSYIILADIRTDDIGMLMALENIGYTKTDIEIQGFTIYKQKDGVSNYFWSDPRNVLAIGEGSKVFTSSFPQFIYDNNRSIWDYTVEELLQYKLIYVFDDGIDFRYQKEKLEEMLCKVAEGGTVVFYEAEFNEKIRLFDLRQSYNSEKSPITMYSTEYNPVEVPKIILLTSQKEMVGAYTGSTSNDLIPYLYFQNGANGSIEIMLGKHGDNGEIMMVGNKMSGYLLPSYVKAFGPDGKNYSNAIENSKKIKLIYNQIFEWYGVSHQSRPAKVSNINLIGNDFFSMEFEYSFENEKTITVSRLYSENFKITVNGVTITPEKKEGLISITLPAGNNNVKIQYGLNVKNIICFGISLVSLIIVIFMSVFKKRIVRKIAKRQSRRNMFLTASCDGRTGPNVTSDIEKAVSDDQNEFFDLNMESMIDKAWERFLSLDEDFNPEDYDDLEEIETIEETDDHQDSDNDIMDKESVDPLAEAPEDKDIPLSNENAVIVEAPETKETKPIVKTSNFAVSDENDDELRFEPTYAEHEYEVGPMYSDGEEAFDESEYTIYSDGESVLDDETINGKKTDYRIDFRTGTMEIRSEGRDSGGENNDSDKTVIEDLLKYKPVENKNIQKRIKIISVKSDT